jgi:hypothetical protein
MTSNLGLRRPNMRGVRARTALVPIVFASLVVAGACGNDPTGPLPVAEQFEAYWQAFDREYPYFPLKGIDWAALGAEHRPRASTAANTSKLVEILREMAAPLRDIHVAFTSPAGERIPTYEPDAFVNWNRDVWLALVGAGGWTQVKTNLGYARLDGIPYIAIGSWNTQHFAADDFDSILERFRDEPSLILDVRPNGGGNDALALLVAARFAAAPAFFESVQFRNGPGHDDFGPRQNRNLEGRGPWRYEGQVYLLTGRGVFSSNETFVAAMRELPDVTVVGDTTGGGSANPASYPLGDGWQYTVSRWIARTADDIIIEGNGIPPDLFVAATAADFTDGRDPVLERAIALAMRTRSPADELQVGFLTVRSAVNPSAVTRPGRRAWPGGREASRRTRRRAG